MRYSARDGGDWPSSVGLPGQALNHPELRWLKTVVVSVIRILTTTDHQGNRMCIPFES